MSSTSTNNVAPVDPAPVGSSNSGPSKITLEFLNTLKHFQILKHSLSQLVKQSEFWDLDYKYIYELCQPHMTAKMMEDAFYDWIMLDIPNRNRRPYLEKFCEFKWRQLHPEGQTEQQNVNVNELKVELGKRDQKVLELEVKLKELEKTITSQKVHILVLEQQKSSAQMNYAKMRGLENTRRQLTQELTNANVELENLRLELEKVTKELEESKSKELGSTTPAREETAAPAPGDWRSKYEALELQFQNYQTNQESKIEELKEKLRARDQIISTQRELEKMTKNQICEDWVQAQDEEEISELNGIGIGATATENGVPAPAAPVEAQSSSSRRTKSTATTTGTKRFSQTIGTGAGAGDARIPIKKTKITSGVGGSESDPGPGSSSKSNATPQTPSQTPKKSTPKKQNGSDPPGSGSGWRVFF